MSILSSLIVFFLTITLSIHTKMLASADKLNQNSSAAYNSVSSDNICNNNVALDVILIDNNKNVVKRDVNGDRRAHPRADQKSLLIVFDGTGSMYDDLQQLRSGAEEIINEMSSNDDNPIFNYILVVYRDPNVESPFDTQNPSELLEKLSSINVSGGGDCPELALQGLRIALQLALPNSLAYVFSDATAKDYGFYEDVVELIQRKQVVVNFLLTGDCDAQNSYGYQVYHKISRVSNGQVYDMSKNNVKEVLLAIRQSVSHNNVALKSFDVESRGTSQTDLNVDKSISQLSVRVSGKHPKLSIKDPSNETVKSGEELSLENLKLVNIKDPKAGLWKIGTEAESAHSVRLSAISDVKFDFGFSASEVTKKSETSFLPLKGTRNVLSIFVSDAALINTLTNITIALDPTNPSETATKFTLPLNKINDQIYATKAFDVPRQMFKIHLNGVDANGNSIERLISTGLIASSGSPPEVKIEALKSEIYEGENLNLKCYTSSQIFVEIAWSFNGYVLQKIFSNQSNDLELKISDAKQSDQGVYSCSAFNRLGNDTKEIFATILKYPKVKIHRDEEEMIENTEYFLRCNVENAVGEFLMSWHGENGKLLQNNSSVYKFIARSSDNKKQITCRITSDAFLIEDSIKIAVGFAPKFIDDINSYNPIQKIFFGDSLSLSCMTEQSPPLTKIQWHFAKNNSSNFREISANNTNLTLREVNDDQEGTYECIVENKVGSARRKFYVDVIPRESPNIFVNSEIFIVNETESVQLSCACENCLPISNFSWSFSGNDFQAFHNYKESSSKDVQRNSFKTFLKIDSVDETDSGTFQCFIDNKIGSNNASIELIVQSSAKIESIIHNEVALDGKLKVLEGRKISVECVVDGFPEPIIFWQKGREKIVDDAILEIENVQDYHTGIYECVASNLLGASTKTFELIVSSLPKSKGNQVTTILTKEGERVEIFCDLMARPEPQIYWKFNSKEIEENKFIIENRKLSFIADESDSGIFNCLGVNQHGRTSIDFTVVVMTHPKILQSDDEYFEIKFGSNLSLSCDVFGYPEPHVHFTKNFVQIVNSSKYFIDQVSFDDAGVYHCIAKNEVGRSEKVFYVSIVEDVKIISNFENLTLTTNQTKNVECIASGTPNPRVSWKYQDGSTISTSNILKLTSNSRIGLYTCIAQNSQGTYEKSIHINVINKPTIQPTAADLQTIIKIKENDDLELSCPFDNFNQISWQLNNKSINNMEHKLIDRKLIIHNVNAVEHNGIWSCVAINVAGNGSFSYNVSVLASPQIFASWNLQDRGISDFFVTESDIDERTFKRGENLILNCTSKGAPKPKIVWKKSTDVIGEGEILTIENLQFYHSDIYTCTAENAQGSGKKFFKIDVISPPVIDDTVNVQKKFQKVIGDSVLLRCSSVIANPPPLFFWFKDNELLDDESEDHLEIDSLDASHDGKYKCLAKNKYGSAKINFHISMYEPAKILAVHEEHKNDDSLELTCTVHGSPLPLISFVQNGHVMSSTSKLNIEKLFKASQQDNVIYFDGFGNGLTYLDPFEVKLSKQKFYSKLTKIDEKTLKLDMNFKEREKLKNSKFTCYGFNALGRDEKSIEVTINRKPHVKEKNKKIPTEIEILEHLPLLLTCLIDGEPQPKITWQKDGRQIFENETIKFINDNKFLSIPEAFSWNSGNYSCIGKNSEGQHEIKFYVNILAPPKFSDYSIKTLESRYYNDKAKIVKSNENEEIVKVIRGEDLILECWPEASPKPKIHWVKLNFFDGLQNEILMESGNVLTLNSIQESANYLCYANNSIGNVQKLFFIDVQFAPQFIDSKSEEHLTVKLNHGLNFECKVKASPEASISWFYNSTNITRNVNDFYFSSNNDIMRINAINKNHEGKFICTATNEHGSVQKVFYVKVEIPIQFSPWSEWSVCSQSCGAHGIQYRSRTCILLDGTPSYNCTGEIMQMRKCNDINCPINGKFGNFSKWSACPQCYHERSEKPKQKRKRKCDSPAPAFGGLNCEGAEVEERECAIDFCPINGGWSEWGNWGECSKTCGRGTKIRKRYCNNPTPKYNGKICVGDNVEYEECKVRSCSNFDMRKSFNELNSEESTESFREFAEFEMMSGERNFQFMEHRSEEFSLPQNGPKTPKVRVTLDTYRPISAETYNRHINNDEDNYFEPEFSDSIELIDTTTTPRVHHRACSIGFKFNSQLNHCEEIDECKQRELNNCRDDEKCVNTVGSYRCETKK